MVSAIANRATNKVARKLVAMPRFLRAIFNNGICDIPNRKIAPLINNRGLVVWPKMLKLVST
jgi:hypothetical protein